MVGFHSTRNASAFGVGVEVGAAGRGVLVGGRGVWVGGTGVSVGGTGVLVGGSAVCVGVADGVALGDAVFVTVAVAVWVGVAGTAVGTGSVAVGTGGVAVGAGAAGLQAAMSRMESSTMSVLLVMGSPFREIVIETKFTARLDLARHCKR